MAIDSARLLKKLEPPVRPVESRAVATPPAPFERQGFDQLLSLVSRGSVTSGRGVTIDAAVELDEPLEPSQLERLAAAADLAETSGAARAVMLMDGRGYVMDIGERHVSSALSADPAHRLVDIDAAVYVAGDDEEAAARATPLPGTGLVPPSIAQQFEEARLARAEREGHPSRERDEGTAA